MVRAAPPEGRPHLRKLRAILRSAAPKARETIKWGNPFFVEPRFLFAYSAHKAHVSLAPSPTALDAFRKDLRKHDRTRYMLKIRYDEPLPVTLIRRIAQYRVREVQKRKDDSFW